MDKTIELKLSLDDVNVIIGALGKMPLETVLKVFDEIKTQAAPQLHEMPPTPPVPSKDK